MNAIAYSILKKEKYKNIFVLDGYWVSHARPDNRWADKTNSIGQNLIHPGPEVLHAMIQVFWNLVHVASPGHCGNHI